MKTKQDKLALAYAEIKRLKRMNKLQKQLIMRQRKVIDRCRYVCFASKVYDNLSIEFTGGCEKPCEN